MPDDRLAAAVAELYETAPERFTERRSELAAAARDAGDRAAAKAIGALRRPTRAAWVVNRLARSDPSVAGKLAELGGALRAAQEARHGPRLRELSAARGALVDALTAQALATAGVPDPPPSLRLEVSETLAAALADPEVAAAFATGTLTRAMQWSGFGVLPAAAATTQDARGAAGAVPGLRPGEGAMGEGLPHDLGGPRGDHSPGGDEELASLAAKRAARRREQHEEAERAAAAASNAAAEAQSAEDRLEAEVRDLEQRLTQARADLAAARTRARHAETAERRARQALDHLSLNLALSRSPAAARDAALAYVSTVILPPARSRGLSGMLRHLRAERAHVAAGAGPDLGGGLHQVRGQHPGSCAAVMYCRAATNGGKLPVL